MGIAYNTSIVRNGLLVHLDAANIKSYPGSGTAWKDLSGNGNDCSALSGLNYETTNGGGLVMNDGNEIITIPFSNSMNQLKTGNFTVETFVRSDNVVYPRSRHPMKFGHTVNTASTAGWSVGHTSSTNFIQVRVADGTNLATTNISHGTIEESKYYHRIFTVDRTNGCLTKYYLNGVFVGQLDATSVTGEIYNSSLTEDGGGFSFGNVWGWRYIGSLNIIKIYNRALSVIEINQNFEALRGRYGV